MPSTGHRGAASRHRDCRSWPLPPHGSESARRFQTTRPSGPVVTLKAPPHTAHALENWRIRAFQILGPEQDIVRRFSFVDARLVVPPGEAGGKHLRVERANQQSETNHWQTLLNELRGKGVDEFRRRFVLPGSGPEQNGAAQPESQAPRVPEGAVAHHRDLR